MALSNIQRSVTAAAAVCKAQLNTVRDILTTATADKKGKTTIKGDEFDELTFRAGLMLGLSHCIDGGGTTGGVPEDLSAWPLAHVTTQVSALLDSPKRRRLELTAPRRGELLALLDHAAVLVDEACAKLEGTGNKGLTQ